MRVAINGCGVAGPTLAYWLRHYGHEAVLFEQSPSLREGGYLIDFWGSGFKVADKMGIVPALRETSLMVENIRSVDTHGQVTAQLGVGALAEIMDGDYFSIARSEVARQIYLCLGEVETHFGCTVDRFDDEGDALSLTRSDGAIERYDLLIGADGLHSHIRQLAFGDQQQFERPMGLHVAGIVLDGYLPRDELTYVQFTRPNRQISRVALRDDKTFVLMVFADHLIGAAPTNQAEEKAVLRQAFGGIGWESDAILERLDEAGGIYFDRVSQIEMPSWSKGRTALIGDAAACASLLAGEGTGLAMTEAYVLAGELHRSGGDHVAAFAAYQNLLQRYVAKKQKGARGFKGFFAPKSQFGIVLRDIGIWLAAIPFLTKPLLGAGLTSQIELPEYD